MLGVGELGEAQLPDVAGQRRLGDGIALRRKRLPQVFLIVDTSLAHDPQNRRLALHFHATRSLKTGLPPS